jgi:hypothetical protein
MLQSSFECGLALPDHESNGVEASHFLKHSGLVHAYPIDWVGATGHLNLSCSEISTVVFLSVCLSHSFCGSVPTGVMNMLFFPDLSPNLILTLSVALCQQQIVHTFHLREVCVQMHVQPQF